MKTMRNLIIGFTIGFMFPAGAALISRVYTFSDGSVLTASQLNSEFNNIINGVNSVDNANISVSANIDPIKISASLAGSGLGRNGTTGVLSVNSDNSTVEIDADTLRVKDLGITTAKLNNLGVTTAKLDDLSVTNGKVANSTLTTAKLAASFVDETTIENTGSTVRIKDLGVTTAKLANGSVTQAKREALTSQTSSSSGYFTTTSASFVDVTNQSITITSTGRPMFVGLIGVPGSQSAITGDAGDFEIVRDSSSIYSFFNINSNYPPGSFWTIDTPSAGSVTYKFRARRFFGDDTIEILNIRLVAYEL